MNLQPHHWIAVAGAVFLLLAPFLALFQPVAGLISLAVFAILTWAALAANDFEDPTP